MHAIEFMKTTAIAGAIILAPAFGIAAGPNSTVPGVPASYMWGDSHTASALMQNVARDATKIAGETSALEVNAAAPEAQMQHIQGETDKLSRQLNRLDSIGNAVVPAGQAAIHQATPFVQEITQNEAAAESDLRDGSQSSAYRSALENLRMQASGLAEEMRSDVPLERTQNEQMYLARNAAYLRKNLGMLLVFGK